MFLKFLVFSYFDWHISGKNWKNLYFFGVKFVLKQGGASIGKIYAAQVCIGYKKIAIGRPGKFAKPGVHPLRATVP